MRTVLRIDIICGEATCESAPGKFCAYYRSEINPTEAVCMLFPSTWESTTKLVVNADGQIARCDDCMRAST